MSRVRIGRVAGKDATINNANTLSVTASNGVVLTQDGNVANLSVNFDILQAKITGEPNQVVGFDENGNPVPVPAGYELYGFELQMDESEPANMVRYIAQNGGFTKAGLVNGVFSYGDWENAWFIKNLRPCMLKYDGSVAYDLMKSDYTKKVDGSASDVANDSFGGNAMVGIPTVWVKVDTSVPRKPKFYFSNMQLDGGFKAYAHHDSNGNVMSYTYMPIYNGWKDGSGRMRSLSGKTPTANETGANQITECRANNITGDDAWDIEKFVDRQLINLLLILIGKTTDSQTAFGNGNMNGYNNPASGAGTNGVLPTGTMNTNGLFYGSTADNLGVKVFGIEHYWGNLWRRTMGLVLSAGETYYKLTSGTEDGSTVQGFDPSAIADNAGTPTGWIHGPSLTGGAQSSDYWLGYISDMTAGDYGLLPTNMSGGSSSTKYCDYGYRRITQNRVAILGGNTTNVTGCGAFVCDLNIVLSDGGWHMNASISCKPNA